MSPWQSAWISLAGPIIGQRSARRSCWVLRRAAGLGAAPGARLRRLPAQPVQPAPDRDPRRRLDLARDQDDAARRHAREGERDHGRLLRPRCAAAPRDGRRARPAAPALMSIDRHILERDDVDLDAARRDDRRGVPDGLRGGRPGAAAGGDGVRLGADSSRQRRVRAGPRVRPRAGRGRLRGRHRRRPGRDGGREPRREGGRRLLGRLQHRAPARAGRRTPTSTWASRSATSTRAR